jgi:hypothetical protein
MPRVVGPTARTLSRLIQMGSRSEIVSLSIGTRAVALVEPAGRYPCCLRSPPVAGRRPLGVSRERRYHRTIQPRTHAYRYGERHHQDVAGPTSLMSHSSLRAPIVPTVRLRRVSRPSGFQRQGRRERGPTGLWSPSRSHSMSLFCGSLWGAEMWSVMKHTYKCGAIRRVRVVR